MIPFNHFNELIWLNKVNKQGITFIHSRADYGYQVFNFLQPSSCQLKAVVVVVLYSEKTAGAMCTGGGGPALSDTHVMANLSLAADPAPDQWLRVVHPGLPLPPPQLNALPATTDRAALLDTDVCIVTEIHFMSEPWFYACTTNQLLINKSTVHQT